MAAFMVVCYHYSAEEAWDLFSSLKTSLVPFRDAGEEPSNFECTVLDCLKGLQRAIELGWYNYRKFDHKVYEANHKLDNGDMNWIAPRKILALSSPTDNDGDGLPPEHFVDQFLDMGIRSVIRLNESLYDERVFRRRGINVYNLEFLDGSCPE